MAFRTQKISQMTPKGANLEATDLIEVSTIESGSYVTRSITGQEIIDAAVGNVDWGDIGGTLSAQTDLQSALDAKVPTSRTLTINGVTQDLSADRTFTISTGITIGSTAITSGTVGRILFEGAGNVVQESSSLFWDNTNGRLGIGTSTAPSGSVYIDNSGNDVKQHLVLKNSDAGSGAQVHLDLHNNVAGSSYSSGASLFLCSSTHAAPYASALGFWNYLNGPIALATNSAERMRVASTGNVLINTTTDSGFRLDVNGTARVQGATTISAALTVSVSNLPVFNLNDTLQNHTWQFRSNGTTLWFIANGQNRVLFRDNGNVLIGTTTDAGFRLDVNGTARVSGVLTLNNNIEFSSYNRTIANSSFPLATIFTGQVRSLSDLIDGGGTNGITFLNNGGAIRGRIYGTTGNWYIGSSPADVASSLLTLESTTRGFLPPRMTTTQKNAIATPAAGLMVYDTTLNVISYYNGSMWI